MNTEKRNALMRTYELEGLQIGDYDLAELERLDTRKATLTEQYLNLTGFFQSRRRKELKPQIDAAQSAIDALVTRIRASGNAVSRPTPKADAPVDLKGTLFKNDSVHIYLTGEYSMPIVIGSGILLDFDLAIINNSEDRIDPRYSCVVNGWTVRIATQIDRIEPGTKVKRSISMDISEADIKKPGEITACTLTTQIDDEKQTVELALAGTGFVTRACRSSDRSEPDRSNESENTMYILRGKRIRAYLTGGYSVHKRLNAEDSLYLDAVFINDSEYSVTFNVTQASINGTSVRVITTPGYRMPAGARIRNQIDLKSSEAGIKSLSALRSIQLTTRAASGEDTSIDLLNEQTVDLTFNRSAFTTSAIPEILDLYEVVEKYRSILADHYHTIHQSLLPDAYEASDFCPDIDESTLHEHFDILLQAYLYSLLLQNDAINTASITLLQSLSEYESICDRVGDEPECVSISWDDIPALSCSSRSNLNDYFENCSARFTDAIACALSAGDDIDEIRSDLEEAVNCIVVSLAEAVSAELEDVPAFLPPKPDALAARRIADRLSGNTSESEPDDSEPDDSEPDDSEPMTSAEYLDSVYSNRVPVSFGVFTLDLPQNCTHTSRDDLDIFRFSPDGSELVGMIVVDHRKLPEATAKHFLDYYRRIEQQLLAAREGAPEYSCRLIESHGKLAMDLRYSLDENTPWVATYTFIKHCESLHVSIFDLDASVAQINALANALFPTIRLEAPVPTVPGFEKYHYAEYERYARPDHDNVPDNDMLIIDGTVVNCGTLKHQTFLIVSQPDGKKWHIVTGVPTPDSDHDGACFNSLMGKQVRVLGEYRGYSKPFRMPAVFVLFDGCVIDLPSNTVVQTVGSAMARLFKGITGNDVLAFSDQLD